MFILSTIGHLAEQYSRVRTRYLTERTLSSLPYEIQKDIGWPNTDDVRRPARTQTGY